jgi:hypothetical protein
MLFLVSLFQGSAMLRQDLYFTIFLGDGYAAPLEIIKWSTAVNSNSFPRRAYDRCISMNPDQILVPFHFS